MSDVTNYCLVCEARGLSVREAFAKAGHPVPEGFKLCFGGAQCATRWFYIKPTFTYGCIYRIDKDRWSAQCALPNFYPDLSNLPAQDAYDALPQVVRDTISPAGGER